MKSQESVEEEIQQSTIKLSETFELEKTQLRRRFEELIDAERASKLSESVELQLKIQSLVAQRDEIQKISDAALDEKKQALRETEQALRASAE